MSKISIIAAVGKNNELGKNNDLIWHLPNDLKFFKEVTMGKPILMGYNTYLSLPKLLPGRKHIVLSFDDVSLPDGVELFKNINAALDYIKKYDEVFVIGGASIYKEFIKYADNIYLTEINDTSDADVYFPTFDKNKYKREVIKENSDNGIKYEHVLYTKE